MNKELKKNRVPELLAPAGSLAAGLTAFDYGADAVYAGLAKFNARERTENFTLEEMAKLITYAHKIKKKVYLTFNTLVKESELIEVAETISEVSKLGPDAIIVQDFGVLRLIREYFPFLEIHASTQMGVHNSAGINFLAKCGVKRIIMERQVTFQELETIIENSRLDIEVFIHGALCCSMSGNCLLSSWQGGYSGNRGKCKQPCRKLYQAETGEKGYYLSTKDLCFLEAISTLKSMGVKSLKIEGRLKKPDYVSKVVSAYRLVLDSQEKDVLLKAKSILIRSPGRKWCAGFSTLESCHGVIEYKSLGISGQLYGKVIRVKPDGFEAMLSHNIHIGDRIRVQPKSGEEGPALTVSKLYFNGEPVNKVLKGQICLIRTDKEIPYNSSIFKIGESSGDQISRIANLHTCLHDIDLDISITENSVSVVAYLPGETFKWNKDCLFEKAQKHPTHVGIIENEFRSPKNSSLSAGKITVNLQENLFIPSSVLKEIRREFWDALVHGTNMDVFYRDSIEGLNRFKDYYNTVTSSTKTHCRSTVFLPDNKSNNIKNSVLCHSLDDFNSLTDEVILPEYCFEFDINRIKRKIRMAVDRGKYNFRITSLYAFELLKDFKNIKVTTSYPFQVSNSLAVKEVENFSVISGVNLLSVQAWVELDKEEIIGAHLKTNVNVELYKFGRPHLLVTRARIPVLGRMSDLRNNNFFLKRDKQGLTYLYPEKIFQMDEMNDVSYFYDLVNVDVKHISELKQILMP